MLDQSMLGQAGVIDAVVNIVLFTVFAVLILVLLAGAFMYLFVDEHQKTKHHRKKQQATVRELFWPRQATDEVRSQLEAHFDRAERQLRNGADKAKEQVINIFEDA